MRRGLFYKPFTNNSRLFTVIYVASQTKKKKTEIRIIIIISVLFIKAYGVTRMTVKARELSINSFF